MSPDFFLGRCLETQPELDPTNRLHSAELASATKLRYDPSIVIKKADKGAVDLRGDVSSS